MDTNMLLKLSKIIEGKLKDKPKINIFNGLETLVNCPFYSRIDPTAALYLMVLEHNQETIIYAGSTGNIKQRFSSHLSKYNTRFGRYPLLHDAFYKYGVDAFKIYIVAECKPTKENIRLLTLLEEEVFIPAYKEAGFTVLSTTRRRKHSKETIKKFRENGKTSFLGRKHSKETLAKMGKAVIAIDKEGNRREFITLKEAGKEYSVTPQTIGRCIKNKVPIKSGINFYFKEL
jgi:hypothetical protein